MLFDVGMTKFEQTPVYRYISMYEMLRVRVIILRFSIFNTST